MGSSSHSHHTSLSDGAFAKTGIASGSPGCLSRAFPRYCVDMTGLLEVALRRVESLSREEQDSIASRITEALDDEDAWTRSFQEKPAALQAMAREAMEEHRRGETRLLDELLR